MAIVDIFNTNNKYKVILADPPWAFNSKKTGGSMTSGSEHQYKAVMSVDELKKLPVTDLADDDCLLVMWWVGSQPQEALDLCKEWGFKLANMNGFVWNKLTKHGLPFFGMGFYTRAGSESALIAVKGKASNLITDHSVRAVRSAVVGKHSAKPHEFYSDIEKMTGSKGIELFARNTMEGWDCFGNEVKDGK